MGNRDKTPSIQKSMRFGLPLLLASFITACPARAGLQNNQQTDVFERRVRPILIEHCYSCHGKDKRTENGLRVDSRKALLEGGDSGPAIVPGQPEASLLVQVIRRTSKDFKAMPPDEPLNNQDRESLIAWIQDGAFWPETAPTLMGQENPAGPTADLWSLQPLSNPVIPAVKATVWPRNTIDRFVLARMEAADLRPVEDAGPHTFIRRVYFDLTGLPPPPNAVHAFINDASPNRVERLVDRLLNSPRFGERWGRHWLDLARFAESSGKEFNFTYPHAWPYRNYVIDSFNADKPYDRFLLEQLAGDLLPADGTADKDALRIATGFLAIGVKRHNSGKQSFRADIIDDQIDVTSRAVLGLSVACVRCHDHKFDPIPTQDYYALAGIFQSTELLYGTIKQKYSNHPSEVVALGPNGPAMHAAAERYEAQFNKVSEAIDAKKKDLKKQEEKQQEDSKKETQSPVKESQSTEEQTTANDAESVTDVVQRLQQEIADLEKQSKKLKASRPARPQYAFAARDATKPQNAKVALRGNPGKLGDEIPRGFLSRVEIAECTPNPKQSGRLELARWLSHEKNPLTPRVMVNRIWHHLFGCGLVKTVDNFGTLGESPSHPELLDWLAARFQQEGWSVKQMIRLMMLSRTYQLGSSYSMKQGGATGLANQRSAQLAAATKDPDNRLLWKMSPRRLEAEAIRDSMLRVSGQLDLSWPRGSTVTGLGDKLVRNIGLDKLQPASRHRSVYLPVIRDYLPEFFELFDFPSPSLVSGRRNATTVPLQDLFMQNDPWVAHLAQAAARQLLDRAKADDPSRINEAFQRTLSRPPTQIEREKSVRYIQHARQAIAQDANRETGDVEIAAWAGLFQAVFCAAEFRYLMDVD